MIIFFTFTRCFILLLDTSVYVFDFKFTVAQKNAKVKLICSAIISERGTSMFNTKKKIRIFS